MFGAVRCPVREQVVVEYIKQAAASGSEPGLTADGHSRRRLGSHGPGNPMNRDGENHPVGLTGCRRVLPYVLPRGVTPPPARRAILH
jgi:hypothetical protein